MIPKKYIVPVGVLTVGLVGVWSTWDFKMISLANVVLGVGLVIVAHFDESVD